MKKEQAIAYEKAKTEVADDIAKAELAKIEKNELAKQTESQQEREQLIADAYRLTGRIEGVKAVKEFATVSELLLIKQIVDNKVYRDMPGIGTVDKYCESLGYSYRTIKERLDNLNEFGAEFYETVSKLGIGYRELRKLRSAASDGTLAISDQSITISIVEGETETIPLTDTTSLKDALEELISAKDEVIAAKERELKAQKEVAEFKAKRMDDTEKALMKAEKKLREFEGGEIAGMPSEDYPAFSGMQQIAADISEIYVKLNNLSNSELSDNNTKYLHGTIMHMVHLAGELSLIVPSYGELNTTEAETDAAQALPIPGIRNMKGHKPAQK